MEHETRAYIRRRGRLTQAQARALEEHRGRFGITTQDIAGDVSIEIGFGMGRELLAWARAEPERPLVGIEMYEPGVGALLNGLVADGLDNVAVIERPAQEVIAELAEATVREVRIFFPDPWPKKRHHKRRLIQNDFVEDLGRVLTDAGLVRLATDWSPYAEWMRDCFGEVAAFQSVIDRVTGAGEQSSGMGRGQTKFEHRGRRLGHDVHDLVYERVSRKPT